MAWLSTVATLPLWEIIGAAGAVGWLLSALAVACMLVVAYKIVVFLRSGIWRTGFAGEVKRLLSQGKVEQAVAAMDGYRHPAAQLVRVAADRAGNPLIGHDTLQAELEQISLGCLDRLRSGLKIVSAIATLSPLLGLLGTVLGMIEAFRQMEAAGSQVDPSILSGGIWLALLTTAIGLVVAIPATAAHMWLNAVCQRASRQLEDMGTAVLGALKIRSAWMAEDSDLGRGGYSQAAE